MFLLNGHSQNVKLLSREACSLLFLFCEAVFSEALFFEALFLAKHWEGDQPNRAHLGMGNSRFLGTRFPVTRKQNSTLNKLTVPRTGEQHTDAPFVLSEHDP